MLTVVEEESDRGVRRGAVLPKASRDLDRVHELTGLSKTDAFNRAISVLAVVEERLAKGEKLGFVARDATYIDIIELV